MRLRSSRRVMNTLRLWSGRCGRHSERVCRASREDDAEHLYAAPHPWATEQPVELKIAAFTGKQVLGVKVLQNQIPQIVW